MLAVDNGLSGISDDEYEKMGIDIAKAEDDFASKGCLVSISIHKPTLRVQLSWEDIGIPDNVTVLASPPSTKPPTGYNNFTRLEQSMRNTIRRFSIGGMEGFRFMPWANFEKCLAEVIPYKEEYEAFVPTFLEDYEVQKERIIDDWVIQAGTIWDNLQDGAHMSRGEFINRVEGRLRKSLPSSNELPAKFGVAIKSLQFSVGKGAKVENAPLTLKYAKQMAKDTFNDFFTEVASDLRQRTAEMAGKVLDVMKKNGKISDKSLQPLREYIKLFESLNVIDDSEVAQQVAKIKEFLKADKETINSKTFVNFGHTLGEAVSMASQDLDEVVKNKMQAMYGGGGLTGRKLML